MISAQQLDALDPQTRQAVLTLLAEVQQRDAEIAFKQALIDKLTHEMAILKRMKFAATSERFASTLSPEQRILLEETLDTDIHELDGELQRHRKKSDKKDEGEKQLPKRAPVPPHLARRDVPHEPADTTSGCGKAMQRIGEDVAEKLDYHPGVFTVERHVRGKWVCKCCERIVQAPVPAHVFDKGIPTVGLLAQVLVAKFMDHLPLYRQEAVFARAGHLIARSTLAQWVGECGAQL
jgi:transposase